MFNLLRNFALNRLQTFAFGDPLAPYVKAISDAVQGLGYHPNRYEASPNACCFDARDAGRAYTCWLSVVTPSVFHLLVFREADVEGLPSSPGLELGEPAQKVPMCGWALVLNMRLVYGSITSADLRSGVFSKTLQASLAQALDCAERGLPLQPPAIQMSGFTARPAL